MEASPFAGRRDGPGAASGSTPQRGGSVTAAVFFFHHRTSFSADRNAALLALTTSLLGTLAAALALAPTISRLRQQRLPVLPACARCLGAAVGGSPIAAAVFVAVGVATPRLACEPAWVAAGPLVAYALYAPLPLGAALVSGVAVALNRWRGAR